MKNKKGFTIIELIVVIAIIAILAGIILLNVMNYIKKGRDAAIKENMHTVQTDVLSDATSASGLVFTSADPCTYVVGPPVHGTKAWAGVTKLQSGAVCNSNFGVGASPTNDSFCACAQELSDASKYICIDTSGLKEGADCTGTCAAGKASYTCP